MKVSVRERQAAISALTTPSPLAISGEASKGSVEVLHKSVAGRAIALSKRVAFILLLRVGMKIENLFFESV